MGTVQRFIPATQFTDQKTLDSALLFGVSMVVFGLVFSVNSWLARIRASHNPQILVLSMFVPMAIARVIAERRARQQKRLIWRGPKAVTHHRPHWDRDESMEAYRPPAGSSRP